MASSGSEAPLVGLTTYVERSRHGSWDEVSALLPMTYVNATIRSGGVPILLPPSPAEPPAVLSVLDALVVTGGPDVDPARYGADSHPETDTPRPERDEWESALCLEAIAMDLPLLAVCRGLQVMNVALGGSLHQHLPELTGDESHRRVKGQMSPNRIHVDKGTSLATILGTEPEGWCHHHQAIDRLGRDLTVVARAGDETVEAVELAGRTFALGVQWHPESNADDDRLFESLVRAATDYRKRRAA